MTSTEWVPQVRQAPSGFVAQRMQEEMNGHGWWLLTYAENGAVNLLVLNDDEVADWPALTVSG
jgi:hypothetical protein